MSCGSNIETLNTISSDQSCLKLNRVSDLSRGWIPQEIIFPYKKIAIYKTAGPHSWNRLFRYSAEVRYDHTIRSGLQFSIRYIDKNRHSANLSHETSILKESGVHTVHIQYSVHILQGLQGFVLNFDFSIYLDHILLSSLNHYQYQCD